MYIRQYSSDRNITNILWAWYLFRKLTHKILSWQGIVFSRYTWWICLILNTTWYLISHNKWFNRNHYSFNPVRYRLHTKDHFGNPNGINILEIQLKTIHYKFCNQNTIYISICMTTWTQNYNPTSLWKQKAWAFFPRANRFVWMVFLLIARSYKLANYDLGMIFDIEYIL